MTIDTRWQAHHCPALGECYYETRLPCGLTVAVSPKELSTYYATVGVRYGSMDMPAEVGRFPLGVAHFLEHKLFEKPDGGDADEDFAALGAEVNAYTSYDRTAYLFSCTDRFPEALEALLTMVGSLSVTPSSVSKERDIIAEEIRMNADSPWEVCYTRMLRALYRPAARGGHRVREEICGSESSIRQITPALLRRTFGQFYTPENMVLAVSGRVDPDEVLAIAERVMGQGTTPAQPPPPLRVFRETEGVWRPYTEVRMQTAKPLFCIGVKDPAVPADAAALLRRDLSMTVLSEMLFSRSGDFYSDLFESGTVSPGMSYGSSVGREFGFYALSGECDDPRAVYAAFRGYVERLRREGLSPAEFHRARRILYADFVTGFDSTEDVATSLCNYALDGLCLYDFLRVAEDMTFDEVSDLFLSTFREGQYSLSAVLPL